MAKEMVITPRLRGGQKTPRQRVSEDRRTEAVRRRKRGMMMKAAAMRRATRGRNRRRGKKNPSLSSLRHFGKVVPALGWLAILAEVTIAGGQLLRRLDGASGRLIDAQDAHATAGLNDETSQALNDARNFIEGNSHFLRIIAKEGRVNDEIAAVFARQLKQAKIIRGGEDLIARDPKLDFPESIVDLIIAKARAAFLKYKVDRAAKQINEWLRKNKGG